MNHSDFIFNFANRLIKKLKRQNKNRGKKMTKKTASNRMQ